ncbi:radical SAM family heme chaperone HemW [Megamonas sp.]
MNNFGMYIHIPFCRQKCFYCDFASVKAPESLYRQYTKALCQEIVLYRELFPDICLDTIYFGGGTPSILPPQLIGEILAEIKNSFALNNPCEITLEANPGTVDEAKLYQLRQNGINRISFGVQAAQNELLKNIGRIHTIEEAEKAVDDAQKTGFKNISVDLMYGLPQQTFIMLQQSVAWAVSRNVQHISIYGLQIEEGTVFGRLYDEGKLLLPTEEDCEKMYDYLTETLPKYGYRRYEISNFAQTGYESRHNMAYWQDKPYLGLGAGAHGYYRQKRVQNPFDIKKYIKKCGQGVLPFETEETVDAKAHMEEFCFLALRTIWGINKQKFEEVFHKDIHAVYGEKIEALRQKNLLEETDTTVALTTKGMKFGNSVFGEFLL